MSDHPQYPSPYTPPPQYNPWNYAYANPQDAYLGPAVRASWLMFILGGLLLACGACFAAMPSIIARMSPAQLDEIHRANPAVEISVFKQIAPIVAALFSLPALALAALAWPVRKGSRGAAIAGLVVTSLLLALMGVHVIGAALQAVAGAGVAAVASICMIGAPAALMVLLAAWLIQAIRAAGQYKAALAAYQQQYAQYMRNQQVYAQGQYPQPFPQYSQPQQQSSQQQYPPPPPQGPAGPQG